MAISEFVSAADRPLTVRCRGDLIVHPQQFAGQRYLGIKDPLTLRFYQLREEEFFIFQQLDGTNSLTEIQTAFALRFAPARVSVTQLQQFLGMLHREGLVVSEGRQQAHELLDRRDRRRRQSRGAAFRNPLAIRFRGIDPDRIFTQLYPWCRWAFTPAALFLCVLLIIAASVLLVVDFDRFVAQLPGLAAFFGPRGLIGLLVAIAVAKLLHEFGHGLACKHFGGRCHELGVMLLVFAPCLYVNVSDSWMLPSKWQRVAIAAAGMFVELTLAATCTFVWWFSAPGLLNSICLRLMFVSSVSTLVFNGNPLLRYDGYYILSDVLEVPNLQERSRALVLGWLSERICGLRLTVDRLFPDRFRWLMVIYAIAAAVYRVIVVAAILWFCHALLAPYGLQVVAQLLTVFVLGGMFVVPLWRVWGFLAHPLRRHRVNWRRFVTTSIVMACLVAVGLLLPLPHRITVPAVLRPEDGRRVFVPVGGTLVWAIDAGRVVRAEEEIGRLEDAQLALEITRLRGERDGLEVQLDALQRRADQQVNRGVADAGSLIPATEKALADVQTRLQERVGESLRLVLTAPTAGTVLSPPRRRPPTDSDTLAAWGGSPLEPHNQGAYLETGTLFAVIGDPQRLEAVLIVDQADIEFVRRGQVVRIRLGQLPGDELRGTVREQSQIDMQDPPAELIATGALPTYRDANGELVVADTWYQVTVTLEPRTDQSSVSRPLPGAAGWARIEAGRLSCGSRLRRYLDSTFRLPW